METGANLHPTFSPFGSTEVSFVLLDKPVQWFYKL